MFAMTDTAIDSQGLRKALADGRAGACVTFEGWVRDHHQGREVLRLEYEVYTAMAEKEGERIVTQAIEDFGLEAARCVHRTGMLQIGEIAVWVGVSSGHREEAFAACRFIIDEVKKRAPIWKKEYYADGDSGWVNCEGCAADRSAAGASGGASL